jgi:hypothetical protein
MLYVESEDPFNLAFFASRLSASSAVDSTPTAWPTECIELGTPVRPRRL